MLPIALIPLAEIIASAVAAAIVAKVMPESINLDIKFKS